MRRVVAARLAYTLADEAAREVTQGAGGGGGEEGGADARAAGGEGGHRCLVVRDLALMRRVGVPRLLAGALAVALVKRLRAAAVDALARRREVHVSRVPALFAGAQGRSVRRGVGRCSRIGWAGWCAGLLLLLP